MEKIKEAAQEYMDTHKMDLTNVLTVKAYVSNILADFATSPAAREYWSEQLGKEQRIVDESALRTNSHNIDDSKI